MKKIILGVIILVMSNLVFADVMDARPDIRPMDNQDIVRISGTWGEQRSAEGRVHFHTGIDFAAFFGKKIKASADGKVFFAGELSGYGWTIIIKHEFTQIEAKYENGKWILVNVPHVVYSLYGHCSKQLVLEGQDIKKGQVIAHVGTTGRTEGSHLHYELRNADSKPIFNGTYQRRESIERGYKYKYMTAEEIAYQKLTGVY